MFPGIAQGVDIVWIAVTYTNLSTVLWREEIEPRMGGLPSITLDKTRHDVHVKDHGSLLLRSAEPDAIRSVRGVGKRLGGVIIDEAAHLALRSALQDVILPALVDNSGWLIIMSTTNAGQDGDYDDVGRPMVPSYFNQIATQIGKGERGPEWEQFTGTAYDNPNLERKAIDELVGEYTAGTVALQQEVYAELLEGGLGLALPGVSRDKHLVAPFSPEPHWPKFAAFDWGFHHPWVFGHYTGDEDGQVYKLDTLIGRQMLPEEINERVRAGGVDLSKVLVYAGPDIWQSRVKTFGKGRTEFPGPTIAEALQKLGWRLVPASNMRVLGLNNLRRYLHIDAAKPTVPPRFQMMDTPGNRVTLAQLQAMTLDTDNPEDVLKVDADGAGRGGDDCYDETRYALMSRPLRAPKGDSVPDVKQPHRANPIKIEHGKVVQVKRAPTTAAELLDQLEAKQSRSRLPRGRERLPPRRY